MKAGMFMAVFCVGLIAAGSNTGAGVPIRYVPLPPVATAPETPSVRIPPQYVGVVLASAIDAGVPGWLFARLIEKESAYREQAVRKNRNGTFDYGMAQLNSRYLPDFQWFDNDGKPFDPMKPEEALPVAARYLRRLYDATGDWWMAVAAYECGLTKVREGRVPDSTARTSDFVTGRTD